MDNSFTLKMFLTFLSLAIPLEEAARAAPASPAAEFLDAHNQARAVVGVPPLKWSQNLASATSLLTRFQRNNLKCQFANLTAGKYGGNQLLASGGTVTPKMAVNHWVEQKKYYIYADNSCSSPDQHCGVYTQVVWRNSSELGCAQVVCVKEQSSLTICFYNPPGNIIGEKPY